MTGFDLMTLHLLCQPLPPLPEIPGRQHRAHDDADGLDLIDDIPTVAELAATLGITRQGAHLRLRQFHATGDRGRLLAPKNCNRGRTKRERC